MMVTWNELMAMTVHEYGPFVQKRMIDIENLDELTAEQRELGLKKAAELYFEYHKSQNSNAIDAASLENRLQDLVEQQYSESDCGSIAETISLPSPGPNIPSTYYESERIAWESLLATDGRPCYDIDEASHVFEDPGLLADILTYWQLEDPNRSRYQVLQTQKEAWDAFLSDFKQHGYSDRELSWDDISIIQKRRTKHGLSNEPSTWAKIKICRKLHIWVEYQDRVLRLLGSHQNHLKDLRDRLAVIKEEHTQRSARLQDLWNLEELDEPMHHTSLIGYTNSHHSLSKIAADSWWKTSVIKHKVEVAKSIDHPTAFGTEQWQAYAQLALANAEQEIQAETQIPSLERLGLEEYRFQQRLEVFETIINEAPNEYEGLLSSQDLVAKFETELRAAELESKNDEDAQHTAYAACTLASHLASIRRQRLYTEQQHILVAWTEQQRIELEGDNP